MLDLHNDLKKTNYVCVFGWSSLIRSMYKKSWPPAAEVAEVEEHIPAEVGQNPVEEVDRILAEEVQLLHMVVAGPPS